MIILLAFLAAVAAPQIDGDFELRPVSTSWKDPIIVKGWAVSQCGPPELTLSVDGRELTRAHPWIERGDIPGPPAGFETLIDPLQYPPGDHWVSITATSCGVTKSLGRHNFVSARSMPALRALATIAIWIALFGGVGIAINRWGEHHHPVPLWRIVPALLAMSIATIIWTGGVRALANSDGAWYLLIAREGYTANAAYAFFPLFPLLLKVLHFELVASIANAVLFAASIRMLQKLMPDRDSGLLAYAALSWAYFFVAVFTESLALFLSVAFVLALRERKGFLAFACGYLAGLTRITSIALVAFAIDAIRKRDVKSASACIGPAAGLASYMGFLWMKTGDPLRFMHVQEFFGRVGGFSSGRLIQLLARSFRTATGWDDVAIAMLVLITIACGMLIAQRRIGEAVYCAALLALPLATVSLTSLHRYALLAFPAFPALAGLLRHRYVYFGIVALEIYFLVVYAWHFGQGHWVG